MICHKKGWMIAGPTCLVCRRAAGAGPCPYGYTRESLPRPGQMPVGPGTRLKAMLGRFEITAEEGCSSCLAMAAQMDSNGPAWCRANIGKIVDAMRAEAGRRGLPFAATAAKILALAAIGRSERR